MWSPEYNLTHREQPLQHEPRQHGCRAPTADQVADVVTSLIAELPDLVRGYEQIKLDNIERRRGRVA